ncbi:MAG: hypothetical protein KF881_10980 [Acidobacteria bacterium]|nr:hypothetical protein [Acidobacteriota bacterium]
MNITIFDVLGTVGVAMIIITYVLLQTGRLLSTQLSYSLLNAIGAALILISLYYSFNLSAFIVEAFWLIISVYGIVRYFASRN